MMTRVLVALVLSVTLIHASTAQAPAPPRGLVGTWTLVSMQRPGTGQAPTSIPNPRGMLVFDRAGHVLEFATSAGRYQGPIAQMSASDVQTVFANGGGFWGGYKIDQAKNTLAFHPEGAVNPNVMGRDITRAYELSEDRLTITAPADAPGAEKNMRWTWDRVPTLDNLSAAQRQVVGFWQHVVERRVNVTTGAVLSETRRAPSIIAYTPSGFVGVHFPPLTRKGFAGDLPTDDEARATFTGYVGYFGVYLVYPGVVYHHQLGSLYNVPTSFRRYFEITGTELNLKFPPAMNQGQLVRTVVTLKRLSGDADMIP
jgi:hypothetical protein